MKFRKLRIAWSVGCGIASVLLIALWVRSYWDSDTVSWNGFIRVSFISTKGEIRLATSNTTFMGAPLLRWHTGGVMPRITLRSRYSSWRFYSDGANMLLVVLHRLPIAIFVLFALVPWIRWRFSLRAVLVAMVIVSGLLCFAVVLTG
jgi:hypothetical protein